MNTQNIALQADLDTDLLPFAVLLHSRGIRHRIFEDSGKQVLELTDVGRRDEVQALYQDWQSGALEVEIERRPGPSIAQTMARRMPRLRSVPVTVILLLLSLAGFVVASLLASPLWLASFSYLPFTITGNQLQFLPQGQEYWRLITPAFLHFGWLHIVFNSLWLWELGSRIERVMGSLNMLGLFLVIAAVSNTVQYFYGGPSLFGGMSGVVYGLLGFAWVGGTLQPRWAIRPMPAIMLFMVGWLVVCLAGVVEAAGFGAVANAAHVGGLLCGAVLGGLFGLMSRGAGRQ